MLHAGQVIARIGNDAAPVCNVIARANSGRTHQAVSLHTPQDGRNHQVVCLLWHAPQEIKKTMEKHTSTAMMETWRYKCWLPVTVAARERAPFGPRTKIFHLKIHPIFQTDELKASY
jgi:hypothetical protein